MERKDKIKLLADLNTAMESKELKSNIQKAPSGEFIWNLLEAAIDANINSLLSDDEGDSEFVTKLTEARDQAIGSFGTLQQQINAIKDSPVMAILQRIGGTLQAAGANLPAPAGQPPQTPAQPEPVAPRRNPEGRSGGLAGLI